ncbi:hypothetical protein [Agrobacterium sp. OT33]|uniref:hypothetical protein n=1 Tax=Agrobacterium sp. OT33 TaxID=2815338 RepID=UPI001A8C39C6|nr:hypothetical protein [Agrobacterium sp. OT33]MBO0124403.1 hypothetical protein [Agrobacterium sp. OT33]
MKTLENLVPKLIEKTSDKSLDWTPGEHSQIFEAEIGKHAIAVWEWTSDEDGTEGVSLGIKPIGAKTFSDVVFYDKYSPRHDKFLELYSCARRSALKIDRMIAEVEKDLEGLFPF